MLSSPAAPAYRPGQILRSSHPGIGQAHLVATDPGMLSYPVGCAPACVHDPENNTSIFVIDIKEMGHGCPPSGRLSVFAAR
jgi:hypothetical protein